MYITRLMEGNYTRAIMVSGIVAAICLFHVPTAAYMMTFDGVWVSSPDGTEISENLDDINAMISFIVLSLVLIPLFIYPWVFETTETVKVFCIAGLPCVAVSILILHVLI